MSERKDRVMERIFLKGKLVTTTPLMVGSGEAESTDRDLVRDWAGKPFLPATAFAGAIRHHLTSRFLKHKNNIDVMFGVKPDKQIDSTQSLLTFYDATLIDEATVAIRDGVALEYETKTAQRGAKYNYEVLEGGRTLNFRLELVIRKMPQVKLKEIKSLLYELLMALKAENIKFGAKNRRGLGKLKLVEEKVLALKMTEEDDVQKWIELDWDNGEFKSGGIDELGMTRLQEVQRDSFEIIIPFSIPYSILIRHHGDRDVDTSHLSSNNKPVISGTSWGGAIRHAIYNILLVLKCQPSKAHAILKDLFGQVDGGAKASRVCIEESEISNGESRKYTRNRIDRFTGGVVDSALFDEKPHYGGRVNLELKLKQPKDWEVGLLMLALKDLGNGIQPVGGAAAVGRGVLSGDVGQYENEETYLRDLFLKIEEVKKNG